MNLPAEQWRVLDTAHRKRNFIEYEGVADISDEIVAAVIRVTHDIAARLQKLGPVEER